MSDVVLLALISLCGTSIGTFGGILVSNKLTNYRIEQLEKKVDKHNNFASRLPVLEEWKENVNEKFDRLESEIREVARRQV